MLINRTNRNFYRLRNYLIMTILGNKLITKKKESTPVIYTDLYLKGDGTVGSTTITDSSPNEFEITNINSVSIVADATASNGKAMSFGPDGIARYLQIPSSELFTFPANTDFTIETFATFNTFLYDQMTLYSRLPNVNNASIRGLLWRTDGYPTNQLSVFDVGGENTTQILNALTSMTAGTRYYLGIKREENVMSMWLNGSQIAENTNANINFNATSLLHIGTEYRYYNGGPQRYMNGKLDEYKVTKGIAKDLSIIPV